jgi:ABC-type glycerol-3-phosphate transport system substrate-binding protein
MIGLAGCSSNDGNGSGGGGDGGGGTDGGNGGGGGGQSGEWKDLSEKEVHVVSEEASQEFQNFWKDVSEAFNQATGATVRMDYSSEASLERVAELLQAGSPPEVVHASAAAALNLLDQGVLAPVNEAVEYIEEHYGKVPSDVSVTQDGDEYIALDQLNAGGVWYRGDIFDEAPTTWAKLLEQAEKHDSEGGVRGGFVPAGKSLCTETFLLSFAYSNGTQVMRRQNGGVRIAMHRGEDRDKWIETLEFLRELHSYSPQNSDAGCGALTQALTVESSAMSYYPGARPKLSVIDNEKSFAADVHPAGIPEKETQTTYGFPSGYVTFEGGNSTAGAEFIKFLMQEEYLTRILLLSPIHNAPVVEGVAETDSYKQGIEDLPSAWSDQDIEIALDQARDFQSLALETDPPNPFNNAILGSQILSDVIYDATVGGKDIPTVVDKYGEELQRVIDDAK